MKDDQLIAIDEWDGVHLWVDSLALADLRIELRIADRESDRVQEVTCETPCQLVAPFARMGLQWRPFGSQDWRAVSRAEIRSPLEYSLSWDGPAGFAEPGVGDFVVGVDDQRAACFVVVAVHPGELRVATVGAAEPSQVIRRDHTFQVHAGEGRWTNRAAVETPYLAASGDEFACRSLPRRQESIKIAVRRKGPNTEAS